MRPWDPERIGPYAIVSRLGAGAMGQVYLARSAAGRPVAIKTIKPELAEEEGFRTRFAQEVAAARRVSGFFTATVVEADPDADVPWLATAYVPAPSLRRMVQVCGPLPPLTVCWLAAGCAEALASIHAVGLVHMDLKPSNVLVAADGPRVIDFGVARALGRIGYAPQHGPVGTPAYMAPEQAVDVRQASPASDVFSLGGTLLYAATGHPPYSGETTADVLIQLANELPDLTGLPAGLTGLVTCCLDRDPKRRPSSTAVLARVGQFTGDQTYLPASAYALIGQYQPGKAGDTDETTPSVLALPDKVRPEAPPPDPWPGLRSLPALRLWSVLNSVPLLRSLPLLRRTLPASEPGPRRSRLPAWIGWSIAGAALVASGVILGATLTSSGASGTPGATGTHGGAAANRGTGPGSSAGSNPNPGSGSSPASAPRGSPTLAQLNAITGPRCGTRIKTLPALCVNTKIGIPGDTFSMKALGFPARTRVTIVLLFYPPPQAAGSRPLPTTLRTFSMPVGSTERLGAFYTLGSYQLVATAPGGRGVSAAFAIVPSTPPP